MKIYFDTDPQTGAIRFHHEAILGPRQIPTWKSEEERATGKRPVMVDNPDCRIPSGATEITAKRFEELMAAQRGGGLIALLDGKLIISAHEQSGPEHAAARRRRRDQLLAGSDWTQLPDAPLTEDEKADWRDYRQSLRDLDMAGTSWPLAPDGEEEE